MSHRLQNPESRRYGCRAWIWVEVGLPWMPTATSRFYEQDRRLSPNHVPKEVAVYNGRLHHGNGDTSLGPYRIVGVWWSGEQQFSCIYQPPQRRCSSALFTDSCPLHLTCSTSICARPAFFAAVYALISRPPPPEPSSRLFGDVNPLLAES